jgi:hypothetical protein
MSTRTHTHTHRCTWQLVDEGATLDAEFYDAYISSLVGARKFRRAHQIYFHMAKRQKLPATATTYKHLITIYGESKRWDLVQECFPPLFLAAAPSFVSTDRCSLSYPAH